MRLLLPTALVVALAAIVVALCAQQAASTRPHVPRLSPQNGEIQVVQSAEFTGDRLTEQAPLSWGGDFSAHHETLAVEVGERYQTIFGFGGAFTEAGAYVFSQLNATQQEAVVASYVGDSGIGYSVHRVHINSCDFSLGSYNFDNVSGDWALEQFDISHDHIWMLPFIQRYLAAYRAAPRDGIAYPRIFATPWSPPPWMKGNHEMTGSSQPGLINSTAVHQSWALYYSKFIAAYAAQGVQLWGITVQNEPEFAAPWEACVYDPAQQAAFLKGYLGPQLRADYPNLTVMIYDHNKDHIVEWAETILGDADAAQYVDGTAFHWYSGSQFYNLNTTHHLFPDKFLLATEACVCPPVPPPGVWSRGEQYGYDILGDLANWAVGWTDWNMLLDTQGGPNHLHGFCDAPIIADPVTQQLWHMPQYYYYGQVSAYVPPGAVRIGLAANVTATSPDLIAVPFLLPDNDTVVVVAMNQGDDPLLVKLRPGTAGNSGNLAAKLAMPEHSIVTVSWKLSQVPAAAAAGH